MREFHPQRILAVLSREFSSSRKKIELTDSQRAVRQELLQREKDPGETFSQNVKKHEKRIAEEPPKLLKSIDSEETFAEHVTRRVGWPFV